MSPSPSAQRRASVLDLRPVTGRAAPPRFGGRGRPPFKLVDKVGLGGHDLYLR